jgi:hypothetical protein
MRGNKKHGHIHRKNGKKISSKTYMVWATMKQRCFNPNNKKYKNYGARGITVCERWLDFNNFLEDMGEKPEGYSIERIDVNANYDPSNCIWMPLNNQSFNKQKKPHGYRGTKTYSTWQNIKARCDNPNYSGYKKFGGAGIKYKESWKTFENFLEDMGECPVNHTLLRYDETLDFDEFNCFWSLITWNIKDTKSKKINKALADQSSVLQSGT